ncbi:hypothetical protein EMGBS3_14230 [Anaerolineaceae bacterium]|nr:hypothetical protein EMGBS3_14230 [Anaerolineaceae bacterium]
MVRNVARQRGEQINRFATAVFDLPDLGRTRPLRQPATLQNIFSGLTKLFWCGRWQTAAKVFMCAGNIATPLLRFISA